MKSLPLLLALLVCGIAHADAPGPVPPIDCAAPPKAKPHKRPVRHGVVPRIPYVSLMCPTPPRLIVVPPPSEQDYDRPAFLPKGHGWPERPSGEQQWEADERLGRHPKPVVVHSVPEPGTLILVLAGLFAIQRIRADREGQS